MSYLEELFDAGLLLPSGVDGLYGRGAVFEAVVQGLDRAITRIGVDQGAEAMRFPPAMTRAELERSGYLKGFPHLAGTVHCFCGNERDHQELLRCVEAGEDWTAGQKASEIALVPAACYPIYPVMARRGALPAGGATVDVLSYCFRHEPSLDPMRMQMFRMREYVRLGGPEEVRDFREEWMARGRALVERLALPVEIDVANDPFFGRRGKIMGESQRAEALKFELLVPITEGAAPTACLSFNYHRDHFGQTWGLRQSGGEVAHTACVGFGLERLTLALLRHHGLDPAAWPAGVRDVLESGA